MSNVSIFVAHEGCKHLCSFCNQHIISGQNKSVTKEDVVASLERALETGGENKNQIAFFGGSFTAIDRAYMTELLEATVPFRDKFEGLRISTRPDCIDEEILSFLKSYDVRAIELGAQSMDNEVLALNRRGHTAEDVVNASELIKRQGFELGLQMMTGLYGDTDSKALETAKALAALEPATIRIYPTVVLKGTELERLYKEGKFKPQSVEKAAELCAGLIPIFENAGIKIIRLGLHASEGVEKQAVGGAYHPAFKELCLAKIYLKNAITALENIKKGSVTLAVGQRYISQMAGQKKSNIIALKEMGYDVKIKADSFLKEYEVKVINE